MSKKDINDLLSIIQEKDPNFLPQNNIAFIGDNLIEALGGYTLSIEDINEMPDITIDYAIEPILPMPALMMIFAAAGVGKTFYTLNLAYALVTAQPFLKYQIPSFRSVFYADGEMSLYGMQTRLREMQKTYGSIIEPKDFVMLSPDMLPPHIRMPQIDREEGQAFYEKYLTDNKIDILILDNLSTLSSFDESSSSEWKVIQDWLIKLRSMGKTVICVHHAGKSNDYRGTSRMMDVMNTVVQLERDAAIENDPVMGKYMFTVNYKKHRDFEGKDAAPFHAFKSAFSWSHKSKEMSDIEQIQEYLDQNLTQRQIASETGLSLSKVNRLLKKIKK